NNTISNVTGTFLHIDPATYNLRITTSEGITKDTVVIIPDEYLKKPLTTYHFTNQICELKGNIKITATQGNSPFNVKLGANTFPSGHVFTDLVAGTYFFSVLNTAGCLVDTLTINIKFYPCQPVVFPNTFTPNNDAINDMFLPSLIGKASGYKLTIYNRYGLLL